MDPGLDFLRGDHNSTSHFNVEQDPDPAPRQSDATGLQILQGSCLSLQASLVSVDFEPLESRHFECNADPDPSFLLSVEPHSDPASQNNGNGI